MQKFEAITYRDAPRLPAGFFGGPTYEFIWPRQAPPEPPPFVPRETLTVLGPREYLYIAPPAPRP